MVLGDKMPFKGTFRLTVTQNGGAFHYLAEVIPKGSTEIIDSYDGISKKKLFSFADKYHNYRIEYLGKKHFGIERDVKKHLG